MGTDSLNQIVSFDTSHYFFVKRIIGILVILGIMIIIQKIVNKEDIISKNFFIDNYDKVKLGLSIIMFPAYFLLMEFIGKFNPNMGYGFLFGSIIFMLCASAIFIYDKEEKFDKKKVIIGTISSILTPIFTWYIFSFTLGITLP